jgi:TfoX/Sxy family transcriptional regulator of competence genes
MAYSYSLADRVRQALRQTRQIKEKKMFGGLAFMFRGNLLVGVWEDAFIVRLDPERAAEALRRPYVSQFEVGGRAMRGWIVVEPDGLESDRELSDWIERAIEFVVTLPAK